MRDLGSGFVDVEQAPAERAGQQLTFGWHVLAQRCSSRPGSRAGAGRVHSAFGARALASPFRHRCECVSACVEPG